MWYGGHGDYMWAGMLVWLVVVGVLIGLVAWLAVRASSAGSHPAPPPLPPAVPPPPPTPRVSSARAILDDRYARGEIDDDEYRRRRTLLDGD